MTLYDQYAHGIIRVKVPVPFPLQWVNSYILQDGAGYIIIDPGLHTDRAKQAWQAVFDQLKVQPQQIRQVMLTHHHPDHYGLAGWMQEISGCDVFMSRAGHELTQRMWGEQESMTEELCALFASHGLPPDKLEQMRQHMRDFIPLVSPQPEVKYIEEGETWTAGELLFRNVTVSGHAFRHLCFIEEKHQLMFCGDHILPRITPNISYLPNEDPDPLHSFLSGLDTLSAYEMGQVYPGHRDPFDHIQRRAADLRQHHEQRLHEVTRLLAQPLSAYELCQCMFGTRLTIHQLRFAMSETLAHLIYLARRAYVSVQDESRTPLYVRRRPYLPQ